MIGSGQFLICYASIVFLLRFIAGRNELGSVIEFVKIVFSWGRYRTWSTSTTIVGLIWRIFDAEYETSSKTSLDALLYEISGFWVFGISNCVWQAWKMFPTLSLLSSFNDRTNLVVRFKERRIIRCRLVLVWLDGERIRACIYVSLFRFKNEGKFRNSAVLGYFSEL